MSQNQLPLLKVKDLTREFPAGETSIQILKGINLEPIQNIFYAKLSLKRLN